MPDFDWQQVTENLKRYLPSYLRVHVEPAKDKLAQEMADHLNQYPDHIATILYNRE